MCFDYVDRDNIVYIVTSLLVCIRLFIEIWYCVFSYSASKFFGTIHDLLIFQRSKGLNAAERRLMPAFMYTTAKPETQMLLFRSLLT